MKKRIIPKFDTKRVLPDGWKTYLYAAQNWWADLKWNISTWWFWWAKGWPHEKRCPECAGQKTHVKHDQAYDCDLCKATGAVRRKQVHGPVVFSPYGD